MASGINNTFRLGGVAVGVAALGALLESRIEDELKPVAGANAHALAGAVSSAGLRGVAGHPELVDAARSAFVVGLNDLLWTGSAVLVVGAVAAAALLRTPQTATAPAAPTTEPS
jgi:hypothetical protein